MTDQTVMAITGTRKGIGRHLAEHYGAKGFQVIGCSRRPLDGNLTNYHHFCLDVTDEAEVKRMFSKIRTTFGKLDVLVNNAGTASMNHALLTPMKTVHNILNTNVAGTFLFSREAAKLMKKTKHGRIVNFASVAVPLKLEGEAVYASSKAAVVTLTHILARELAEFRITVNAVAPAPVKTDLIRSVTENKIRALVNRQAIRNLCEFADISNVVDFFIKPESHFITGQVIYLGGV